MSGQKIKKTYLNPSGLKEYIDAAFAKETYPCIRGITSPTYWGRKRILYSSLLLGTFTLCAISVTIYMTTKRMRQKSCHNSNGSSKNKKN